jgi:rhodanese-related sulfurtransferase
LKPLKAEILDMKKIYSMLALILVLSGCMFQKPDYVKSITPAELNQLMHTGDIFLVDVHTPEQQHIKGTDLVIPYNEIEKYQDKFPKDKNTPIYLYCEGGPMGNAAARSLHELGYDNISNLEGGANAWRKAGLEFE